jgi:hypothetical protein
MYPPRSYRDPLPSPSESVQLCTEIDWRIGLAPIWGADEPIEEQWSASARLHAADTKGIEGSPNLDRESPRQGFVRDAEREPWRSGCRWCDLEEWTIELEFDSVHFERGVQLIHGAAYRDLERDGLYEPILGRGKCPAESLLGGVCDQVCALSSGEGVRIEAIERMLEGRESGLSAFEFSRETISNRGGLAGARALGSPSTDVENYPKQAT